VVDLNIEMHFTSWVFPKGHRIRVAVNNAQWPMFWPTPYAMKTTLRLGNEASRLLLPVTVNVIRPGPVYATVEDEEPVLEGRGAQEG
jgi:predicted acyl esterase